MIALLGDAELDEGNIFESMLEGWKQGLRNCWWIVDYNRQSLDAVVREGLWERYENLFRNFGWDVVVLKYGSLQEAAFAEPGGEILRQWIDRCPNQLYSALVFQGGAAWRKRLTDEIGDQGAVTKLIDKLAEKYNRKLHEVPIGFKYICELMLEQNILIGGEESGGIGTSLYLPERDATVSALLLAELMAWHGKSLGELLATLHQEFGEFHYGRVDLDVTPAQKQKAIAHFTDEKLKMFEEWPVVRREDRDGIKIYLGDLGWVMVRASGTENLLRIYAETNNVVTTQKVLRATTAAILAL